VHIFHNENRNAHNEVLSANCSQREVGVPVGSANFIQGVNEFF